MLDVMIIGGGISGASAALYSTYGKLATAVIDSGKSQIKNVSTIFNYPGIKETSGEELLTNIVYQAQNYGAEWINDHVKSIEREPDYFVMMTTSGQTFESKYVIIATNLHVDLLLDLGIDVTVNEKIPSGKIKKVPNLQDNGLTDIKNLYMTGLLAGVPSQAVIAAGHGAKVAIEIVTKETGQTFMWHDK
ncbi:NAD(P)/FAD-dependent oxidoreductase [Bacillus aquiflavi]|uniref:NAD(P)/FAD-dependent oxidoreductase n=1 Tax=Bacillus aquiflavi TaxID=2672567 RepID=A0A6B3VYW2_9BACI|nr:NAD(P)/FAD-dependent oxidoreductase [Bacillus aquiflavi]MBA4537163.1 NAD(P)/FAD-dependent oxidoreductase [Bacillus aquiflavi]NEY82438.1 NAD(P)/FAD-dependent oxidoreductase [Bacillus aquiflavi]